METLIINKTLSSIDNTVFNSIIIIFNKNEFYIHNGIDTLIVLKGDKDIIISSDDLCKHISSVGSHYVAIADTIDIALDAYNQWLKMNNHE